MRCGHKTPKIKFDAKMTLSKVWSTCINSNCLTVFKMNQICVQHTSVFGDYFIDWFIHLLMWFCLIQKEASVCCCFFPFIQMVSINGATPNCKKYLFFQMTVAFFPVQMIKATWKSLSKYTFWEMFIYNPYMLNV